MYWSDCGEKPKIERAAMDGTMRTVIIRENLKGPTGLAIDYNANKLYWADGETKAIEYCNFDGTGRKILIGKLHKTNTRCKIYVTNGLIIEGPDLLHPFGIDVFENNIYWTDWNSSSIETAHKTTGADRSVIASAVKGIMDVRVFHRNRKIIKTGCNNNNGGCTHLCLLKPKGYTCACPTGIKLQVGN